MRTIVLADLHLTRSTPAAITRDLARVVEDHAGARVVIAGDLFDLSAEQEPVPRDRAIEEGLRANPAVRAALASHVEKGGQLWLAAGNHDAEVGVDDFDHALAGVLGLPAGARERVRTTPWFFRDGALHVEHGHVYDPDNAPAHPLVPHARSLGVHFVEQFIAKTGAYAYLNANDKKPLEMFLKAFRWYGLRAPHVIYRFFRAAFSALSQSGPFFAQGQGETWKEGDARVGAFSDRARVDAALTERLVACAAEPTLASWGDTFARLYLDRVAATLAIAGGGTAAVFGQPVIGGGIAAAGALAMMASWARGYDRYGGTVSERLARSAARIGGESGARLVVFGHTHQPEAAEGYANTGSFAFPRGAPGRPFLEIEGTADFPRAVRRFFRSEP